MTRAQRQRHREAPSSIGMVCKWFHIEYCFGRKPGGTVDSIDSYSHSLPGIKSGIDFWVLDHIYLNFQLRKLKTLLQNLICSETTTTWTWPSSELICVELFFLDLHPVIRRRIKTFGSSASNCVFCFKIDHIVTHRHPNPRIYVQVPIALSTSSPYTDNQYNQLSH